MKTTRFLVITVFLSSYLFDSHAFAQITRLSPRETVRVTSPQNFIQPVIFEFLAISHDTLVLKTSTREYFIPFHQVEKLEIRSMGKTNASIGALTGGLVGGATMAIAIALTPDGYSCCSPSTLKGFAIVRLSPISAVIGAGIGAIIGSQSRSIIWTEVPISSIRRGS